MIGEQVRTESGTPATVTGFTVSATPSTMWDLTVDGAHSFFVGSGAVLVHNCTVTFSSAQGWAVSHGGRHLLEMGLTQADVDAAEAAIAADAASRAPQAADTFFTGTVTVAGRTFQYNGYTLAGGIINVGTYKIVP